MKNFEFNGKNEGLYNNVGFFDIIDKFYKTDDFIRICIGSNKVICYYKNSKLHGKFSEYYKNGNIEKKFYCKNNKEVGEYIQYHRNGKIKCFINMTKENEK
jgi:antitoxin component YwqK of YwqJK toxin-antitoxin module